MSERNRTIHDLSVEATFERILSRCQPLPAQSVALAAAAGCVLAEAVIAPHALPPFANAGMDGFAVHVADLADATPQQPVVLPIAGIIQAGDAATTPLVRGTAMRIMTGALLPPGAEAVVPLEDAEALPNARVAFRQPTSPKRHIRPAGEDVPAATVAIPAGKLLRAAEVGLCCAFGITTVPARSALQTASRWPLRSVNTAHSRMWRGLPAIPKPICTPSSTPRWRREPI